jgi:adenine-specific DNA methylase
MSETQQDEDDLELETWDKLPLELMDELAEREKYRRDIYRPVYSMHKWWARRPGSTFRTLGLAALTDDSITKEDILRTNASGTKYQGMYLQAQGDKFNDKTILDPFTGGGTTLFELNRLGANTIGYELNPVAWWINKKIADDVDIGRLEEASERVLEEVQEELGQLYRTTDPDTGRECEVVYSFQTQTLPCLTCDETVKLFKNRTLRRKKKNDPALVYCPNRNCDNRLVELDKDIPDVVTCPNCSTEFDPSDGNSTRAKYTCSNGHKHDIKETLNRIDESPSFEYWAMQYVTPQGEKKYKEVTEEDRQLAREAEELLAEQEDGLPIPTQKIPSGDKTSRLTARSYETWDQLFSDRQLLTYAKLFERAKAVEDDNISEFLITAISNSVERGSSLTKWDHYYNISGHVFERQSYIPRVQPVEGNPINTEQNIVAVENFFDKVITAKEYCKRPFEKLKEDGEVVQYYIQNESTDPERCKSLQCKTSERLDLEDKSVDYVITDPPYYDNVQYSELSGYFYSWLHQVLGDEYEEFEPEHVPSAREIVANERTGKDEQFFIDSLTNVFKECNRVLKDSGEMMFTYHHNENEAWGVILEALVDSGFTITGAYPVQSEMPNSMVIRELENAEYDIIVFANKESSSEETTLDQLRQDLFFELQDMIEEERERHQELSTADLGVVLRGKCMYYYSKHYPEVYADGERVSVDRALETVDDVIEQILEGSANLPPSIDTISEAYAAFVKRGAEEHDDLNKHLMAKNLNVSDLEGEELVVGGRDEKRPVSAEERVNFIGQKLNGQSPGEADNLLDIDKVHYLHHLFVTDQNTSEYLKEWKTDDLEDLADFIADVTGDDRYEKVMELNLGQF